MNFRNISHQPYRELTPVPGTSGLVYADKAARNWYQLVPASEAATLKPGDLIPVGTAYKHVPLDDPRPGYKLPPPSDHLKSVGRHWHRVTEIGRAFVMLEDEVSEYDSDQTSSGEKVSGYRRVSVCQVYFDSAESYAPGDQVAGGETDDDSDTGHVIAVEGDQVTVAWSSGVRTTQPASLLRPAR